MTTWFTEIVNLAADYYIYIIWFLTLFISGYFIGRIHELKSSNLYMSRMQAAREREKIKGEVMR